MEKPRHTARDARMLREIAPKFKGTQRELADIFGMSQGNVNHILTGKTWQTREAGYIPSMC